MHKSWYNICHIRELVPASLFKSNKGIIFTVTVSIAVVCVILPYIRDNYWKDGESNLDRKLRKRSRFKRPKSPKDFVSQVSSERRSLANTNLSSHKAYRKLSVTVSEKGSVVSSAASGYEPLAENLKQATPQQIGVMAMENLENCIYYWESALTMLKTPDDTSGKLPIFGAEEQQFYQELQQLLDAAYELQARSETLFLDQRSILFQHSRKSNGALTKERTTPADEISDGESFASAQDVVADLKEFEEFSDLFPNVEELPLYQLAILHLENGEIPCRNMRTCQVNVGSDVEYLAKLHCIRLAFRHILQEEGHFAWFIDVGRQVLVNLLLFADRDPKDFLVGYQQMIQFLNDGDNWVDIEEELRAKGVKVMSFYDIVLDYILLDAFDDLESPPSSVLAVIQNRWLTDSFKETALTTAVWSVLKAKRRRLKYPYGFMAHFYTISEQISPLMAWAFLGPDETLNQMCLYFKDEVKAFLSDIFSFEKCRYVSVELLAADVLSCMRTRVGNILQRLNQP